MAPNNNPIFDENPWPPALALPLADFNGAAIASAAADGAFKFVDLILLLSCGKFLKMLVVFLDDEDESKRFDDAAAFSPKQRTTELVEQRDKAPRTLNWTNMIICFCCYKSGKEYLNDFCYNTLTVASQVETKQKPPEAMLELSIRDACYG